MPLPEISYNLKETEPPYDFLFKNTPPVYEEIYNLVGEYISYLVERNGEINYVVKPIVRTMTSVLEVDPPLLKKAPLDLDMGDPVAGGPGNNMEFDCSYEMTDMVDTFMVKFNMIMIILQQLCGFKVRPFIL